jgi:hypothetical protein
MIGRGRLKAILQSHESLQNTLTYSEKTVLLQKVMTEKN